MVNETRNDISRSHSKFVERRRQIRRRALQIVKRYTLLSAGIGLIPTPFLYQVAVGGLLSKMLYDLSVLYGTSLSKQKNRAIVAAVLGGAHSEWITFYLRKSIHRLGLLAIGNTVARPVVAAGITYTVGKLFITHFESGAWLKGAATPSVPPLPTK